MFSSAFVLLALSSSALANIFVTSPVASTTFVGGQQSTVSWQDDGSAPTLQSFGPSSVAIYTGNSQQQTLLQEITPSVDVATTASIVFTPNPSVGPTGNEYFIRFQSLSLMDSTNPAYPALAFSAKFSMSSMTGTFNASVQAQIAGQSTAPIGGTAVASSSAAAAVPATSAMVTVTTSTLKSASASAAKTTSASGAAATSTSGAAKLAGAGVAAFAGVAFTLISLW